MSRRAVIRGERLNKRDEDPNVVVSYSSDGAVTVCLETNPSIGIRLKESEAIELMRSLIRRYPLDAMVS